jgi:hypothetical protein
MTSQSASGTHQKYNMMHTNKLQRLTSARNTLCSLLKRRVDGNAVDTVETMVDPSNRNAIHRVKTRQASCKPTHATANVLSIQDTFSTVKQDTESATKHERVERERERERETRRYEREGGSGGGSQELETTLIG